MVKKTALAAMFLAFVVIVAAATISWAEKTKTANVVDNSLTDNQYGFVFEKNDNWKFQTADENPKKPEFFRFEIQKKNSQIPLERKYSPETWNPAYGAFFVDTTSLTLKQIKAMFTEKNAKYQPIKNIAKKTELIKQGLFVEEKDHAFGKLGMGCQLTFKEEYDVQIRDVKDDYDVITDYLIGDMYLTVCADKIFGFLFVAERAEYGVCRTEIEKMLETIAFRAAGDNSADSSGDTTSVKTQ